MSTLQAFFGEYFWPVILLIAVALALTVYIFRRRKFDAGYRKGQAANPEKVRRENPPDEYSRTH